MSSELMPHTIQPHPVTGLYNGKFGMWLFLASEVMLFGALFSSYVLLRVGAEPGTWPTHGETHLDVTIGTINTMVLIVSSVTMVMAWVALKMHNIGQAKGWLAATLILATTFLVVKLALEYRPKLHHYSVWLEGAETKKPLTGHITEESESYIMFVRDAAHGSHETHEPEKIERSKIRRLWNLGPANNTFYAIYWTMTGLHGLHVLGGILVIAYLLLPGSAMWVSDPERFTNRIECTGLYWHFVDLVWIFLFPSLYLM